MEAAGTPHSSQCLALLGATGHTGRLVLRNLLTSGYNQMELHIYVRSKEKLIALFPDILSDTRVTIFQGNIQDDGLMQRCLSGVSTIICTLGENENIPGIRVMQDFARSALEALKSLKDNSSHWKLPRLILLSSATWNKRFADSRPAILHWMIRNAFAQSYEDLVKAQELLKASPSLLSMLLVQPNALVDEAASGCEISTDFAYMAVSYEDLADGFVKLASDPMYTDIDAVGVSSRSAENGLRYFPFVFSKVLRGLMFQFIPGYCRAEYAIYQWLRTLKEKSKKL